MVFKYMEYLEVFDRLEVADLKTMAAEVERIFFTNNGGFNEWRLTFKKWYLTWFNGRSLETYDQLCLGKYLTMYLWGIFENNPSFPPDMNPEMMFECS